MNSLLEKSNEHRICEGNNLTRRAVLAILRVLLVLLVLVVLLIRVVERVRLVLTTSHNVLFEVALNNSIQIFGIFTFERSALPIPNKTFSERKNSGILGNLNIFRRDAPKSGASGAVWQGWRDGW